MNSTKYHLHLFPTRDASPPLELAFLQATNTSAKRYHKTLTQTLLQNANSNGGDASSRREKMQQKERGHGKFVKPNFHAPCANSVSYQCVITQRPNIHRRTSCRNCFGVGRVHIRPDALRFQLHCCRRLSRRAWSTLQCGKAWWLVPCMVFCYSCVVICLK